MRCVLSWEPNRRGEDLLEDVAVVDISLPLSVNQSSSRSFGGASRLVPAPAPRRPCPLHGSDRRDRSTVKRGDSHSELHRILSLHSSGTQRALAGTDGVHNTGGTGRYRFRRVGSKKWRDARAARRERLVPLEGAEGFEGLQRFLDAVYILASKRRLSRYMYLAEKSRL
jgi:hypothetical protein